MGAISEVPGVSRTSSSTSSISSQRQTDQWIRLFMMFVVSSIALVVYMVVTDYKSINFRHSRDYTPHFEIPEVGGKDGMEHFRVPNVDASKIHTTPNSNLSYRLEYNKLTDHNDESKISVRHSLSVTPLEKEEKSLNKSEVNTLEIENQENLIEKNGKILKVEEEIENVIENTLEDPVFEKIEAHPDDDKIRFYVDPSEASVVDSQLESPETLITWTCPFDYPEDFTQLSKILPEFNLRKDKFLINVSPFGPNNQFRGFRDTIMLAYYLNRTIALPGFFKHGTDPSVHKSNFSSNFQSAHEKVDAFELAKFIPTITFEEYGEQCQNGIDFTLFARSSFGAGPYNQLIEYEKRLNISMTKKQSLPSFLKKPKISNLTVFPQKDGINNLDVNKIGNQLFLQMNEIAVDRAYGKKRTGDGKCGMWFMPFRNIYWARAVLGRFGKSKQELAKKTRASHAKTKVNSTHSRTIQTSRNEK